MTGNIYFAHMGEKCARAGDGKGVARANILAAFPTLVIYTAIYATANYFGVDVVQAMLDALPQVVMKTLSVAANIIPVVGFGMLLKFTVVNGREWLLAFFAMGFVLVQNTNMNIVSLVLFSIGIALLFVSSKLLGQKTETRATVAAETAAATVNSLEMEDGEYEE